MALDDLGGEQGAKDDTPEEKKKKRLIYIGIAVSVVGVILTYLLFFRKKSTSATTAQVVTTGTTTAPTAPPTSTVTTTSTGAASSPSSVPSTVDITTPSGASYSGPPTSIPKFISTTHMVPTSPSTQTPTAGRTRITYPTGASYTGPSTKAPTFSPSQQPTTQDTTPSGQSPSTTSTTTHTAWWRQEGYPQQPTLVHPSPPPDAPYSTLGTMGSGYSIIKTGKLSSGVVAGSTGHTYATLSSYTATVQAINSGQTVAYQKSPGVFVPITSVSQLNTIEPNRTKGGKGNTTTYVLSPSSAS